MADIVDTSYLPTTSLIKKSQIKQIKVESPENVEMGGKILSIRLCEAPLWKTLLRYVSYILTALIMYLFNLWFPSLAVAMSLSDTKLYKAQYVVVYGADKNVEVVKLLKEKTSTQSLYVFNYRLFKYYYDENEQVFKACQFRIDKLSFKQIHEEYGKGLERTVVSDNSIFFGKNSTDIPKKSWATLLFQEILSPFYIFQVYSVIVWLFDNYWVYCVMIFVFSVSSITVNLYETIQTRKKLRQMSFYEIPVNTFRKINGETTKVVINSSDLVPGDLFEVPNGVMMPCDAILLSGSCIMNEAMLTGESIPVIKNPLPLNEICYNAKEDKQYTLYAGTKCIQARGYQGAPVMGVVTLTGFATVKGELIRTMLFPKPTDFKFYSDSFKFIGILAIMAIIGFLIDLPSFLNSNEPGLTEKIIIKASEIITVTVPPALPTCMQVGISVALARLKKKQIFCISPNKINETGRVNVMCFDKTGTLTEEGLDLLGVRPVIFDKNAKRIGFAKLIRKVTALNTVSQPTKEADLKNLMSQTNMSTNALFQKTKLLPSEIMLEILATCHSLTMVNGKMIGDPLDLKMFECTKWSLDEKDYQEDGQRVLAVARSLLIRNSEENEFFEEPSNIKGIGIMRRFEFSSKLQRMSVIVKDLDHGDFKLHIKGSPEKIRELCRPDTVPSNFHLVLEKYAREGFRVLACATKIIDPDITEIMLANREDVENDFTFIGLLIMENRLKPITTEIIAQLHAAQIRTIMVTGDNALTAISVARQCNIISPQQRVFLGDLCEKKINGKDVVQWKDFEFSNRALNNDLELDPLSESNIFNSFGLDVSRGLRLSQNGPNFHSGVLEESLTIRRKTTVKQNLLESNARLSNSRMSAMKEKRISQLTNEKLISSSANVVEMEVPFFNMEDNENYCIAVTGKAFSFILQEIENGDSHYQLIFQKMLKKCLVFARMHPDEKALMIKHMMIVSKNIVGMCGDGANDVGALKTANVGVSLSEAEASIAAPFTSNIQDISCIPILLREGRAALATSYQAFKFMALYSIIQFTSVTLLFHELIDLTNWHYYHIDILIILPLSGTMALTQTYDQLTIYKPTGRLVSVQILSSVLGQGLIQIIFQLGTLLLLFNTQSSWYKRGQCVNDFDTYDPCVENTTLYLVSIYQYCTVALVFMVGKPFRKPFYTNLWFTCILGCLFLINLMMTYNPFNFGFITNESLEAEVSLGISWKNTIMGIVLMNSSVTIIWERLIARMISRAWKEYRDKKQQEKEEQGKANLPVISLNIIG